MKTTTDADYLETFLAPLRVCADYLPAFGTSGGAGLSLADFKSLYGADEFYSWIGLDSPLVYAAHRISGGLTSIYRQIGIASERLCREIIKNALGLSDEQVAWRYEYTKSPRKKASGGDRHHKSQGAIFEIRQGYKSADSKRQNADLRFGVRAYQAAHIPVVAILSSQVGETVISRYRDAGMLIMTGIPSRDPTESTFAFFDQIVGYDLTGFFRRSAAAIKQEIHGLIEKLLSTE